jgi:hypothetical protein
LKIYDADKLISAFPGLPLFEFHAANLSEEKAQRESRPRIQPCAVREGGTITITSKSRS